MGRPPCCDKSNVKRGLWTAEEDAKILAYVSNHGIGNWTLVPKIAGLNRCGKSCRLRWTNYLRPDLKHDSFTQQEEELIISLHKAIGSRWSLIAQQLPGRTDNDVKNYWNTKLRKKLIKMEIDPVTHKPFPQVLSDYGNISGLSTSKHLGPINKTLGNKVTAQTTSSSGQNRFSKASINSSVTLEQYQLQENCFADGMKLLQYPFQFQVINNNNDIVQSHFLNDATSSCSSSSSNLRQLNSPQSYSNQPPQEQLNPSFNWSEFLVGDPLMSTEPHQLEMHHELQGVLSSCNYSTQMQNEVCLPRICNGEIYKSNGSVVANMASGATWHSTPCGGLNISKQSESPPSSLDSFVDAILNSDSEMTATFPELYDGSFDF